MHPFSRKESSSWTTAILFLSFRALAYRVLHVLIVTPDTRPPYAIPRTPFISWSFPRRRTIGGRYKGEGLVDMPTRFEEGRSNIIAIITEGVS